MPDVDISVIVPTFNSGKVIGECLKSILSQNGVSLEVIVVDGVSSDGTLDIVRSFRSPNIKIVSQRDTGIYDAINKGIRLTRGSMIGVLGSDDIYRPDVLSVVKSHARLDLGIIAGLTRIDGSLRPDEPYGLSSLISGIPFGHNAMFASRQAYDTVGLYDLRYRICGDAQWVHRAIRAGIRCLKVEEVFVDFGSRGTSSTNAEAIMTETYDAIRENFSFLSREEAKHLLGAFRRWVEPSDVPRMLKDYRSHALFVRVLGDAFPWLKTGNVRRMMSPSVAHRIKSALKQFVLKE